MRLPSGRRTPFAVRTMTAFSTSPFFTRPRGIASLTLTTMVSPTSAYFRREPPSTLMHMTRRAPELSATSSSVVIWIMPSASRTALLRADTSDDFPGLQFRERPAFADADDVARPEFPVLIVRVVFLRASHCLPHHRMGETAFNLHDHGLGVLVAHHDALENAFGHVLNPLPLPLRLARLLAHTRLDAVDLAPDR